MRTLLLLAAMLGALALAGCTDADESNDRDGAAQGGDGTWTNGREAGGEVVVGGGGSAPPPSNETNETNETAES